jgi:hypothetical protein
MDFAVALGLYLANSQLPRWKLLDLGRPHVPLVAQASLDRRWGCFDWKHWHETEAGALAAVQPRYPSGIADSGETAMPIVQLGRFRGTRMTPLTPAFHDVDEQGRTLGEVERYSGLPGNPAQPQAQPSLRYVAFDDVDRGLPGVPAGTAHLRSSRAE